MKLYELTDEYQRVLEWVEDREDEPSIDDWNACLDIEDAYESKVENLAKVIRALKLEEEAIKTERDRFAKKLSGLKGRREWLTRYLQSALVAAGRDKVKGATLTVSLRGCAPSCVVVDESEIPDQWWKTERNLMKREIVANFKATGEIVDGTDMVIDKKSLNIR